MNPRRNAFFWAVFGLFVASLLASVHVPGSAARIDPYKSFKYRLRFDSGDVAGFNNFSSRYGNGAQSISLDGGETLDSDFTGWAADWVKTRSGQSVPTPPTRRNVVVATLDATGKQTAAAQFALCFVDEFTASPDPANGPNAVSVLHARLVCGYPRYPGVPH